MKTRSVHSLLYAEQHDMGGLPIRQPFPTVRVNQIDPFLLLHHHNGKTPQHIEPRHAGVGPHPHRGFSPVTFIFQGGVHHRDSRGNNSIIYAGGAQWMNAGRGIIHSERPPADIHEIGGRQEIIQLWINTPAAHKMDQPVYFPVAASDAPSISSADGLVTGKVFAGTVLEARGPVTSFTDVNAATLVAKAGGTLELPIPPSHNAVLYLLDGQITLEGYGLTDALHAVYFNRDGDGIRFRALQDTRMLFLSGEPIGEPVVSHGPFVMNTTTEILEAMRDYQMGKMGVLIED
ncbi:MAG: pirin family protein [Cyclobacteriaceae bacterium]|nr:pirin family protein [Cyclobacteriaceae bacterium]